MDNIKTLAQRYIQEYKRTPEFGNWDAVIELGKQLADTVLAGPQSYTEPLKKQNIFEPPKKHQFVGTLTLKERSLIEKGEFLLAVKAVRERMNCGLIAAKTICDDYRATLGGKPHRANCGGCLECNPTEWKRP